MKHSQLTKFPKTMLGDEGLEVDGRGDVVGELSKLCADDGERPPMYSTKFLLTNATSSKICFILLASDHVGSE